MTHESLFKAWPALDQWLTEEQAFLTDLERIRAAHENYAKAPDEQKSGELLYGLLLSRARDWLLKYPQRFISREMEPLRAFIAASAEVADAEGARGRSARRKRSASSDATRDRHGDGGGDAAVRATSPASPPSRPTTRARSPKSNAIRR